MTPHFLERKKMDDIKDLYNLINESKDTTNVKEKIKALDLDVVFKNLIELTNNEIVANMLLTEVYKIKKYCHADFKCECYTLADLKKFIDTLDSYN